MGCSEVVLWVRETNYNLLILHLFITHSAYFEYGKGIANGTMIVDLTEPGDCEIMP